MHNIYSFMHKRLLIMFCINSIFQFFFKCNLYMLRGRDVITADGRLTCFDDWNRVLRMRMRVAGWILFHSAPWWNFCDANTPIKTVIVTTVSSHDEVMRHGKVTRTWRASKNLHKSRFRSLFPRDPACSGDCARGSQAHNYAISPEHALLDLHLKKVKRSP